MNPTVSSKMMLFPCRVLMAALLAAATPAPSAGRIVVAADGSGDALTVQKAVDRVVANRAEATGIFVRRGTYDGLVHIPRGKNRIRLVGEDRETTILRGLNNEKMNSGVTRRCVILVEGDDFTLENLTVENTTPPGGSQAEAVCVNADRCVLRHATFRSHQDTLNLNKRVWVGDCRIEGDVDFIWGDGIAVFERCVIHALRDGCIVQARNPAGRDGFVFLDCTLTAEPGVKNQWLARIDAAQFPDSHVSFVRCRMGPHIRAVGWDVTGAAGSGLRFEEFDSTDLAGRPLDTSKRHPASTRLAQDRAATLTARAILSGRDHWTPDAPESCAPRVATVTRTSGCVAFWDFAKREPDGARRFTAHVPTGKTNDFALDAGNYVKDYWGAGREATYADFPLMGRGPFGQAIQIRKETDPDVRPFLFVPRSRLHDSPLDIKGAGKSVTVVVWAIRESGNHALAGIWHEGTDLKQTETTGIRKVERGQRQYALFAGLNKEGSACGHVSENGASSFLNKYALHKCNSADVSPTVPADSPADILDASWQCFAMTFDHERHELTGWLNGQAGDRWLENPKDDKLISYAANAWLQGHLRREPGLQPGEDPDFPESQFYNPPEETPVSVKVLNESGVERVELREYGYTRVRVTLRDGAEVARELVALRLNPWWYPHGIYSPPDATSGGPFTIGRVIHSSRGVGFTGWIGGVAVYDRALTADEVKSLSDIRLLKPVSADSSRRGGSGGPALPSRTRTCASTDIGSLHCIDARTPQGLMEFFKPTGEAFPVVSAHRGGAGKGIPENSFAAFSNTLRHTFAVMEIDPRYTKDGAIVIHHDPTLNRTTTGAGTVTQRTLAELKQLRLKDPEGNVTEERIPTLDEALEWARGKTVLILDQKDVPVTERVKKIAEHKAEAFAMVIVYNFKDAKACYAMNTNIMMEVMIPDAARAAEFEKTGVPWSNVVAFVGHSMPEDPAIFELLRRKGVCSIVGTSRTLDRRFPTIPEDGLADLENEYRTILRKGANLLETDIPADLGPMLYGSTPIPASKKPFLHGSGEEVSGASPASGGRGSIRASAAGVEAGPPGGTKPSETPVSETSTNGPSDLAFQAMLKPEI